MLIFNNDWKGKLDAANSSSPGCEFTPRESVAQPELQKHKLVSVWSICMASIYLVYVAPTPASSTIDRWFPSAAKLAFDGTI